MKLPEIFLNSLEGISGFERDAFVKVHESRQQVTSVRINPGKLSAADIHKLTSPDNDNPLPLSQKIPWSQYGFYLSERPSFTFDPLFHAGCYYVQEASSMFLEQAFLQLVEQRPVKVLDIAAAPGGKSTHIQSLISNDSLLVANEVIRSRSNILTDNIIKWGCNNVIVTNNDPSAFKKLPGYFDVIVADAPCSGSGLFRRDEQAINEWSLNNVQLCSQRQKRILADVMPTLKNNGLLIYSTCSYSKEEDEDIMDWLVSEWKMVNEKIQLQDDWNIVATESVKTKSTGYRFYPDKVLGEGFFISIFRKSEEEKPLKIKATNPDKLNVREVATLQPLVKVDGFSFTKIFENIIALPQNFLSEFQTLRQLLNVQYAGVQAGKVMKDKLVPEHGLALSSILQDSVPNIIVNYENAIRYLQRQDMQLTPDTEGWQVVKYNGFSLGWINALKNRINNYYPKELRILKQYNNKGSQKL